MSKRTFRCCSGLDQCPHSVSGKAFTITDEEYDVWDCPHSIHCKSNLIELTWGQANPLLYRSLIGTIVLIVLGALAWEVWPDILLRECKEYRLSTSNFASEVDQAITQQKKPQWIQTKWKDRIEQIASLELISDAKETAILKGMQQTLESTRCEMETMAKSNDSVLVFDPSRGTDLEIAGNRLMAKASKQKHKAGVLEVTNGLNTLKAALDRLKPSAPRPESEGLSELLSLARERDTKINSRIKEIEYERRKSKELIEGIRKSPVSLHISTTHGIADSLIVPLTQAFVASAYSKNVAHQLDGDVRRVHWTDQNGSTHQIEIVEQTDEIGFESLGRTDPAQRSDIHIAFRGPTNSEGAALRNIGNLLSSDCAQVIALDAVGVLVNAGNPITKLTENQLDELIYGKVVKWDSLGGQDTPVSFVLPFKDGRESVVSAFFEKRLAGSKTERIEGLVDDAMGRSAGNLGLAAFSTCKRSKMLAIQASERTRVLMPSPFTIATEDYKYTARIIAHHAAKASKETAEFMRFAISLEGQKTVGACGYVDLNVKVNSDENDEVIAAIAKKVSPRRLRDAERLSTNLRFETGESNLDIKAQADIRRVVQRLAESDLQDRRLAVLGFADARGGDAVNLPLSERRATSVTDIFISQGVKPSAQMGFGARMPVDTNETEEGMQRNRRVELWILRFQEGK